MSRSALAGIAVLVLGAQLFFTELDFSAVGLAGSGPDVVKWAVLAPLTLVPALLIPALSTRTSRALLRSPQGWMSAWLVWSLITVFWSLEPQQTVLQGFAIAGLWITGFWFASTYGFDRFARVIVAAGSLFLLCGIVRDLASSNYSLDGSDRFFGMSFAATNLARLSVLVLLLAIVIRRDPRIRQAADAAIALSTFVLLGTHTRTVVAALLFAGAVAIGRRYGWRVGMLAAVGIIIVAGLAVALASESDLVSRGEGSADVESINGRATIWGIGLDLAADARWQGYGTAAGEPLWIEAAHDGEISWFAKNAHNLPLDITLSQGLIGLALFVGGIVAYWRRTSLSRAPELNAAMVLILATGVTEAVVNRPSAAILVLGAIFGASMAAPPPTIDLRNDRPVAATVE